MTIAPTIVINIKTRIVSSIGKSLIAVGESRRAFARIRPPELGVFGPSPGRSLLLRGDGTLRFAHANRHARHQFGSAFAPWTQS
jgi:hypothetical protein